MRPFDGYVPAPAQAERLARTPIARQLLGLEPAFDAPCADYEAPARYTARGAAGR